MDARTLKFACCALWLLSACTGNIVPSEGSRRGPAGRSGGGGGGATGAGGGGAVDCNMGPKAPALHARMLSPGQYDNTVLDLVKIDGNPAKDFSGGADLILGEFDVEQRAKAAADIAQQAAASLAAWSPCAPPMVPAAMCEEQLIDWVGLHAYRHPLTAAERAELQKLFDAGVSEKDFTTGVEWFLTGVLQSPDFLYQLIRPAAGEQPGQIVALGGYELASRLSYFLWESMPDDALFAAAGARELDDSAGLLARLRSMTEDGRFLRGVSSFYSNWLKIGEFRELARNDQAFTSDVVLALKTSLLKSVTEMYEDAAPNFATVFQGDSYYLNDTLRAFYGMEGSVTDFAPVSFAGEGRAGILTHPGFMALLARPDQSNPISRGLFVRRRLLCQEIDPPGGKVPDLPPVAPGLSTRDRTDAHVGDPYCAMCHTSIDPPGYAFESFDQVGRHRDLDSGRPVNTSGEMIDSGDLDGPFASGSDLFDRIGTSETVRVCFAEQYFQFAALRNIVPEDRCSVDALGRSFESSGDLKALAVAIASSDSFRYRSSEGGGP